MGKRELLLIVGFVIVGVIVHQVTAPEPAPGQAGFSFSRFLNAARREVSGNRASAEETRTAAHALTGGLTEVRVTGPIAEIEVTGEDRQDVESTVVVHSNSFDEAEAKEHVRQSKLIEDRTASALILRMEFPQGGRQRGTLKLKVPARLHVRVEPGSGRLTVKSVASLEITSTRGEATVQHVAGRVEITHRGGELVIEDVGSLQFNGRSGNVKIAGVRGDASIKMEQGGELEASGLGGRLDLETRDVELKLDDLQSTPGPIRVNANGGEISMKGVRSEARIEARNAELTIAMAAAAPVEIYNDGERVVLTPPPGGFTLDAVTVGGEATLPSGADQLGLRTTKESDRETRVSGSVRGGGPTITVRSNRADFDLRTGDEKPADPKSTEQKLKAR